MPILLILLVIMIDFNGIQTKYFLDCKCYIFSVNFILINSYIMAMEIE